MDIKKKITMYVLEYQGNLLENLCQAFHVFEHAVYSGNEKCMILGKSWNMIFFVFVLYMVYNNRYKIIRYTNNDSFSYKGLETF